jgi:hypothetical protein
MNIISFIIFYSMQYLFILFHYLHSLCLFNNYSQNSYSDTTALKESINKSVIS